MCGRSNQILYIRCLVQLYEYTTCIEILVPRLRIYRRGRKHIVCIYVVVLPLPRPPFDKGVHKYGSILYYISFRFLCPPSNRVNRVLFSMYIPTYAPGVIVILIFLQPSVLVKLPRICRNCFYKIIISLCYRFSLIVFIVHDWYSQFIIL